MANRAKPKEMDPEEELRRKFRAKCRLRAFIRLVMANAYWLIEGVDEYAGVDDVKRRVQQAVRVRSKKKQLLNINDKALLNKPAADRTEQERHYLYRIIGGLKCFKKYPNHVKRKLAAVTYFTYFGPGRTIVRQNQEASALFFVVSGQVSISQTIWDGLLHQYNEVVVASLNPGDMFGEVSLLHNIVRTATVTTIGHCELLKLMKEDFKNILQVTIKKQWDEVSRAMSAFTYFEELDEVALREGCIVAKMKTYQRDDVILGDGVGIPNHVYFVLKGNCQMIETMQVLVTTRLGREFYALHDPYVPQKKSDHDIDKYFTAYNNVAEGSKESHSASANEKLPNSESSNVIPPPAPESSNNMPPPAPESSNIEPPPAPECSPTKSASRSRRRSSSGGGSIQLPSVSQLILKGDDDESQHTRESIRISDTRKPPKVRKSQELRTYFMQVCQMNAGATFGFGENMRDRRVIAAAPVECMLMPKVWLLQKNRANIWTRIQHYLEKKVPTKKELFKRFVEGRRWEQYRTQIVEDVISRSKTVNWTSVHDVPYSIRIEEMTDMSYR